MKPDWNIISQILATCIDWHLLQRSLCMSGCRQLMISFTAVMVTCLILLNRRLCGPCRGPVSVGTVGASTPICFEKDFHCIHWFRGNLILYKNPLYLQFFEHVWKSASTAQKSLWGPCFMWGWYGVRGILLICTNALFIMVYTCIVLIKGGFCWGH